MKLVASGNAHDRANATRAALAAIPANPWLSSILRALRDLRGHFFVDNPAGPAMRLPVNDDDARDLASAIAGDQDAFARIYDRHAAVVLSLCRQKSASIGDVASADDACQETFLRAFRLLPRINGQITGSGGLRPWLYAIARRVCSEAKRSLNRRRIHEGKAMTLAIADASAQSDAARLHVERDASQREQLDRLSAAIALLNDDERLALHLYYLEQDRVCAAGDALRLSRSGYYKLLARAREKLAVAMRAERGAAT